MFNRFNRIAPVIVLCGVVGGSVFGAFVSGAPASGAPEAGAAVSLASFRVAELPLASPGSSVQSAPLSGGGLSAAGPVAPGAAGLQGGAQGGAQAPALRPGGVYRLAPNDQIAITVRGFQDLTTVVAVRPDGKIALPLLGNVEVAGKSVDQVRQLLVKRLTTYILQPDVTVTIVGYHQDRVYVLGDVRAYGTFPYAEGMSAQDALNLAGGADERGDLEHVSVERNHQVVATLDLSDAHGVPFVLQPGDAIMVPRRPLETVTVVGDVQKPGAQPLIRGERILDAITAAGIPPVVTETRLTSAAAEALPTPPDFAHVTLTRGGGAQAVDMSAVMGGDVQGNIPLEPGDVIYVPATQQPGTVTLLGEVAHPQTVRLEPKMRVLDLINLAGSPTPHADLQRVTLRHLDGSVVTLNVENLLSGKDADQNVLLQAGDTVTVPVNRLQVAVLGAVTRPGVYDFKPGDEVLAATLLAGGTAGLASLSDVSLLRYGPDGQTQHFKINLDQVMKKGKTDTDQKLLPGDVIYVSSKGQGGGGLTTALSALSVLRLFLP